MKRIVSILLVSLGLFIPLHLGHADGGELPAPAKVQVWYLSDSEKDDFEIRWQMLYGTNGTRWYVSENGKKVYEQMLKSNSPEAQSNSVRFSRKPGEKHSYEVYLCNPSGCTPSMNIVTVVVPDPAPDSAEQEDADTDDEAGVADEADEAGVADEADEAGVADEADEAGVADEANEADEANADTLPTNSNMDADKNPSVSASTMKVFSDLGVHAPLAEVALKAKQQGWLDGYSDGTLRPNNPVNRAEFTKLALRAFRVDDELPPPGGEMIFPDVSINEWFGLPLYTANKFGYMKGYSDGSMKPNQTITRVEAIKIVFEMLGEEYTDTGAQYSDTQSGQWYSKYTSFNFSEGLLGKAHGDFFYPHRNITRGEAITLISNTLSQQ